MNSLLRFVRIVLQGGKSTGRQVAVFAAQSRAFRQAELLVRLFYAGNLFWAAWRLAERGRWGSYETFQPLWPMAWANGLDVNVVAAAVLTANAIAAALAAIVPTSRVTRWMAFVGMLEAGAFENSFGTIGHGGHAWLWVAFFFALLPTGSRDHFARVRIARQRFLQMFWTAQFAMLFFYSMSGWLKLVTVPVQYHRGEVCALAPEALARHMANRILATDSQPLLADLLVDQPSLSWLLYLGALYLEAFAVMAAFRPALHRLWGGGLILLHLGIGLGMEIWFIPPLFLLSLLFINSPFQCDETKLREAFWQLPGLELPRLAASRAKNI
jgi:hypothetical protein